MAELKTADKWTITQLITAAEKFTFADGKADINETKALIGLVHPFAAQDADIAKFEQILLAVAADERALEILAQHIEQLERLVRERAVRDIIAEQNEARDALGNAVIKARLQRDVVGMYV